NLSIKIFWHVRCTLLDRVIPQTIERCPLLAFHLWTRIFAPSIFWRHLFAPLRHHVCRIQFRFLRHYGITQKQAGHGQPHHILVLKHLLVLLLFAYSICKFGLQQGHILLRGVFEIFLEILAKDRLRIIPHLGGYLKDFHVIFRDESRRLSSPYLLDKLFWRKIGDRFYPPIKRRPAHAHIVGQEVYIEVGIANMIMYMLVKFIEK